MGGGQEREELEEEVESRKGEVEGERWMRKMLGWRVGEEPGKCKEVEGLKGGEVEGEYVRRWRGGVQGRKG